MLLEMCQNARSALTDEGMVTGFLRTGNMFLHRLPEAIYRRKSVKKLWNDGWIVCFVTLKLRGNG